MELCQVREEVLDPGYSNSLQAASYMPPTMTQRLSDCDCQVRLKRLAGRNVEDDPGIRERGCGPINPALTWKGAEQRQMIPHAPARDMPPAIGFQSTGQETKIETFQSVYL